MSSGCPIVRHTDSSDIIAFYGERPITVARFLHDVLALAALVPARRHMLNLCVDRYRFTVAFAAALCRQQISLLPPSATPAVLNELSADYPDLYCLTDSQQLPVACMTFPEDLGDGAEVYRVPLVPAQQSAVILFSSGSTGRPIPTTKSWGTLVSSALAAGRRLGVHAFQSASVIGTVPHQHSYGLESTVLLALQNGLVIDSRRPFYPGDIRARIHTLPTPRILVTTPVHIRALLAEPDEMPTVNLAISATAPLSSAIATRAEARFRAPLLEIYGCTEAGQIATRRPAKGMEWRCLDGVILENRARQYWVRGPLGQTRILLQDMIERTGPDTFLLRGRLADFVDIAGKHTSLTYLNRQLLTIDGVIDGVFFMPDEDGDSERIIRLAALVVAPGLKAETVLQALRDRVDAAFLPRPLILVDALPRNALGKLPRDTLLHLASRQAGG